MEGSVTVTSKLGEGSTFSVELNVGLGTSHRLALPEGEISHNADLLLTKEYLGTLGQKEFEVLWPPSTRLLLVEDNTTNQLVALGMLESIGLYADIAANGLEALASLRLAQDELVPYTLVLMDCQMPEMDGYSASTAIREGKAGESAIKVPIVAMTANAMSGDREKCLLSGMDDYISKPINLVALKAMLIKWLLNKHDIPVTAVPNTSAEMPQNDFVLWDEKDALNRLANNQELLDKVIKSFIIDANIALESLAKALEDNKSDEVQLHAHALKGSAGNVGALKLQEITKQMEEAAKNNHLDEVKACYTPCKETLDETLRVLNRHLANAVKPTVRKKRFDPLSIAIKLQSLKKEVESGGYVDTDSLGIFTDYTDELFTTKMDRLKGYIDGIQTQKAVELINTLIEELE
jgi:CheY-like chemotaxis protein